MGAWSILIKRVAFNEDLLCWQLNEDKDKVAKPIIAIMSLLPTNPVRLAKLFGL